MRLVLADNDADALDLLALDLRLEGYTVEAAVADGAAAVEACRRLRPDVLVVDYRMPPGLDGLEVAPCVLREAGAARVIVYSNYQDGAVVRAAASLGACWLLKGDLAPLRAAVADGLSGRRRHDRGRSSAG